MTEGKILGKMIYFIIPLMLTNLLQTFYNAADMMVVSLSGVKDAVGAIGTTGPVVNLIVNLFIGFSTGTGVLVARNIGAKNDKGVSVTVHTSIVVSAIFGIIGAAVGMIFARPLLVWMGADRKLLDLAVTYTFIYFCGVPFLSVTNYATQIIRAKGDTRTPLVILSLSGALNVLLNLFFVLVCKLSVEGVALATAISNVASSIALLAVLSRDEGPCRFDFKKLRIDREAFKNILQIGIPAGIQSSLFSISNIIISSSVLTVNNLLSPAGASFEPVVNGNAAVANLNSFVYTAANSVYLASITFTSQNVGANKHSRLPRVMVCSYSIAVAIAVSFSLVILAFHKPLLSLYGVVDGPDGSLEHIAFQTAYTRIMIETLTYFLLALLEAGSGVMRGLGRNLTTMLITLVGTCALRIVWIYTVFAAHKTVAMIYVSYPISWGITALCHFTFAVVLISRAIKRERQEAEAAKAMEIADAPLDSVGA